MFTSDGGSLVSTNLQGLGAAIIMLLVTNSRLTYPGRSFWEPPVPWNADRCHSLTADLWCPLWENLEEREKSRTFIRSSLCSCSCRFSPVPCSTKSWFPGVEVRLTRPPIRNTICYAFLLGLRLWAPPNFFPLFFLPNFWRPFFFLRKSTSESLIVQTD